MMLNREFQYTILKLAEEVYPGYTYPNESNQLIDNSPENKKASHHRLAANLKYLEGHDLIERGSLMVSTDNQFAFGYIQMTAKGMDFLADDGGLSSILNVVTVRFEADTLKAILENKINESNLSPEDKNSMIDALRELPAESIKHLSTVLLDKGIESLPSVILLIGTYLGLFS